MRGERVLSSFSSYTRLDEGVTWCARTLREFWLDPERPANRALYEETLRKLETAPTKQEAGLAFMAWFSRCCAVYGSDGVLLADTMGNDFARLAPILPAGTSFQRLFGTYKPGRDTSSYFMGVAGTTTYEALQGSEKHALHALGLSSFPDFGYNETHNPEHDAANIGLKFAFVQNRLLEARGVQL
jgi:hypothetical protein